MTKHPERLGQKFKLKDGSEIEIVRYDGCEDVTIHFIGTDVYRNTSYQRITNGNITRPVNRIGQKCITNEGYEVEIIEHIKHKKDNVIIQFENGYCREVQFGNLKVGEVKNPYHPSICNVGYIGEGTYKTKGKVYSTWRHMLQRGYDEKLKEEFPTYKDIIVCEEWHNFQNFAKWFDENYDSEIMQGWDLDKDIICPECKIYSPETCCFVPKSINYLLLKRQNNRGEYPIGVSKKGKYFYTKVNRKGESVYIGTFTTIEEAFQAYKTAKEQYIKEVAEEYKNQIDIKVYQALYNYQVEITN